MKLNHCQQNAWITLWDKDTLSKGLCSEHTVFQYEPNSKGEALWWFGGARHMCVEREGGAGKSPWEAAGCIQRVFGSALSP